MANVREELVNVVNTLNHIIDTQLDKPKAPIGREVYIVGCGYDKMVIYDNKEDVMQLMIDDGNINDYDCWFDDLERDDIAEICEKNYNLSFRDAMEKGYNEYCEQEFEGLITDLDGSDASIRRAYECSYLRVHLAC